MALADRIEQAEGPSRSLDTEILLFVNPQAHPLSIPPHYTTSIDAALSLVPEEMRDEIEISTLYRVARVGINLNHTEDDGLYYGKNEANSIPLAICAAALRAGKDPDR